MILKEVNNTPPPTTRDRDSAQAERLVRLSLNVSPEALEVLKDYAGRKGVTVTEAVRRAIGVLKYIDDAQERGARLNVEEDGRIKELMFL
jgi:hypothetical protein